MVHRGGAEWISVVDNFAAAVRSDAALTRPGRNGRRTQSILHAMYRSAYDAGGGWMEVHSEL